MAVRVEAPHDLLGAVVRGLDLEGSVPADRAAELRNALWDHLLLVVPGAGTDDALARLAAAFGDPVPAPPELGSRADPTYLERPPIGSVTALATGAAPAPATWTNQYRAYRTLSTRLRRFADETFVVHESHEAGRRALHPMVRTHPVTGNRALYLNRDWVRRIHGATDVESRRVLELVFDHCARRELTETITWEPGDAVVWDNRAVMPDRLPGAAGPAGTSRRLLVYEPTGDRR